MPALAKAGPRRTRQTRTSKGKRGALTGGRPGGLLPAHSHPPPDVLVSSPYPSSERRIEADYTLEQVLGTGNFSTVRLATHKRTQEQFAVKVIDRSTLTISLLSRVKHEMEILLSLDHTNITKLYEVYQDEDNIYLVSRVSAAVLAAPSPGRHRTYCLF